jgi:hypothetical protein
MCHFTLIIIQNIFKKNKGGFRKWIKKDIKKQDTKTYIKT